VPTHPDLAGGLSALAEPVIGVLPAILAASAVIASVWGREILTGRAAVTDVGTPYLVLVAMAELVALGPLLFFAGHLFHSRFEGLRQYGDLALRYTLAFHERWIEKPQGEADAVLGTADIQSLADLGNSFDVLHRMRVVPFGLRAVYMVVLVTLLPMIPLLLTHSSVWEVAVRLGRGLLGGLPG
jgi:hypothetical protein